jgi:hypothetical protein
MSYNALDQRSVSLRAENPIRRTMLSRLIAAAIAWWTRPRLPANLPDYLREDIGLPPQHQPAYWLQIPLNPNDPDPLQRPRL